MPIAIRYLEPEQVIESVYSGAVGPEETVQSVRSAASLARDHGVLRFLSDLGALAAGPSVASLYGLPDLFESLGVPRTAREALVAPTLSPSAGDVRFYENVCSNRGWNVRVFTDRASALAWLSEPPA